MRAMLSSRIVSWRVLLAQPAYARAARVACVLMLFVAIFSGRFSFLRFVDDTARSEWLQLRIVFTAFAALAWLILRQDRDVPRALDTFTRSWLCALAAFHVFLLGHVLLLGEPSAAWSHALDIVIILLQGALAVQIIRSESDLDWFARIAEVVGVVLFLFCLAGFGNPDLNGAGWAPFGGPLTFYRIEFFAFCCALYLCARAQRSGVRYIHLAIAAIALYSTFASLSKVAFIGSMAAVAFMLFWLLTRRRLTEALTLALMVGLVTVAFSQTRGTLLAARMGELSPLASEALGYQLLGAEMSPKDRNWTVALLRRIESGEKVALADLPPWQQRYIRAFVIGRNPESVPLAPVLQSLSRVMIFDDSTGRVRIWVHAVDLFRSNPWLGAGIGNFLFEQVNRYTKQFEIYRHPHNILLELAAALGLVGVGLFSLLLFTSLVLIQQRVLARAELLPLMAYVLFVFITSLAGGDYFDFRVFWLLCLIAVVASRTASAPAEQVTIRTPKDSQNKAP